MTYGSLFSGIGGIDLGLDRAGMRCIWQCEVDDYACRVLEKHWPGVKRYVRGLDTVLGTLATLGYDAEWHCIPAAAVGAPHIRDRVFIIAYTNSERLQKRIHVNGFGGTAGPGKQAGREVIGIPSQEISPNSECGERSFWRKIRRDGWIDESISRDRRWKITNQPVLDGRDYGVPNRLDRLRCLGNAVVPQVAECLGRAIMEYECRTNRKPRAKPAGDK